MAEAVIFQDRDKVYYADSCEPLKAAARRDELYLRGWARGSYPGEPLPPDLLPQLRSIGVWDAARPQSWGLDRHCNEGIEFTYLARGKTAFEVDGRRWLLRQGDLTITRPWQFHQVGNPHVGASRLIWLIIDVDVRRPNQRWRWPPWIVCTPAELQRLTDLLRHNEQPVWSANEAVASCFAKLDALLAAGGPAENQTKLTLYINELLIQLLDMLEQQRIPLNVHLSTTQRMVELFLEELPRHIDFSWTLDGMAQACGLSRSQFSAYCKQITNMTPIAYLTACRVEVAARLLVEQPALTITEVAYACGFNSSQYFATAFRQYCGRTPSQFRLDQQGADTHAASVQEPLV
jgi:AraC family L-rhamnose operon regulatory protein RhaS